MAVLTLLMRYILNEMQRKVSKLIIMLASIYLLHVGSQILGLAHIW